MELKKITAKDIATLREILSPDRVFFGQEIKDDFSQDEMPEYGKYMPEAVCEALDTEDVSKVMKYAFDHDIPVIPRGAGTGLCGGAVPVSGGLVLSLARFNKILEIDEDNLIAVIEPGVLLMELAAAALDRGLMYPPDPGEKSATVGGNVMTNAGGMRAVKYGVTRDYVRGMEVVLSDGRILNIGGKIAKNSSGYSLKDIMIGSEGTLGIVTKLILKLIPAPQRTISLLVPFRDMTACIETVPKIIRSRAVPTAMEFLQKKIIETAEEYVGKKFPDKSADAYLLLTFDGNTKEEIDQIYENVAEICINAGAIDVLIADTQERHDALWTARGAFFEAIKCSTTLDECDVVVPRNKIAEFMKFAEGIDGDVGIRIEIFGHAGDGNLHIYTCRDDMADDEWHRKLDLAMDRLYKEAIRLGGQVSGEHGIGHAKKKYLRESVGDDAIELMRGIKNVFDPKGILNPGKVI